MGTEGCGHFQPSHGGALHVSIMVIDKARITHTTLSFAPPSLSTANLDSHSPQSLVGGGKAKASTRLFFFLPPIDCQEKPIQRS